jgi:taspase (threonine aspartase 1)
MPTSGTVPGNLLSSLCAYLQDKLYVTSVGCRYTPITDEQYAALPFPVAAELANMYSYYRQFPYYDENRPMEKRLADGPTFRQWAEAHREELLKKLEPS